MLKEQLTPGEALVSVEEYMRKFKECQEKAKKLVTEYQLLSNRTAQRKMSAWYDRNDVLRKFQVEAKVMMLLPGRGRVTELRFGGPYTIVSRISKVNYEVSKPDCLRELQVCRVNRPKPYFQEEEETSVQKEAT